jgi:integrase
MSVARPSLGGMDILLIPGLWLDGSSWDEAIPVLEQAENGEVPLPDWSLFEGEELADLDDKLRAAFRERALPSPVHVTCDPQRLSDERRYDVPRLIARGIALGLGLRDAAGIPKGTGLHSSRHVSDSQWRKRAAVQMAPGHATPTITLDTYVGEWPEPHEKTRRIIDDALGRVHGMCPDKGHPLMKRQVSACF